MTNNPDWFEQGRAHVWQPYTQAAIAPLALCVSHTEGCYIILEDGRRLIDGISSWWSACHGHNHAHLLAAAKAQLDTMPHVMFAGLAHQPAYTLAQSLAELTHLPHVFFSDSGSTAVEVALKIALQYHTNRGALNKTRFACLAHGYHGDTFGAMGVSDPARGMHHAYLPNINPALTLDVPHSQQDMQQFEATLKAQAHELAALIVEPLVQGAGGMRFYAADTLRMLYEICKRHDVLFIADEIMTGFGRTGSMFACGQAGIRPDILCIGKALTGGMMTLAATLAQSFIYESFLGDDSGTALMHGPTFMANPLACAIANASLDVFEREPRLTQVSAIATQLEQELEPLRNHPAVRDVRVKGALGVVQVDTSLINVNSLREQFINKGCWLRPFGDIVYIAPPFTIAQDELTQLTDAVKYSIHNSSS